MIGSTRVSISACHVEDLGSIPSRDAILFLRNPGDKESHIATSDFLLIKTKSWLDPRFLHLLDLLYTNPLNVEKTVLGLGLTVTLAVFVYGNRRSNCRIFRASYQRAMVHSQRRLLLAGVFTCQRQVCVADDMLLKTFHPRKIWFCLVFFTFVNRKLNSHH